LGKSAPRQTAWTSSFWSAPTLILDQQHTTNQEMFKLLKHCFNFNPSSSNQPANAINKNKLSINFALKQVTVPTITKPEE